MAKRIHTKIGDVFSVKIDEGNKKYFQLIAYDLTQLNSDVIRVFSKVFPINSDPDLLEIINGNVDFHAHCVTKFGVKLDLWKKIGNTPNIDDISNVLFRDTDDYGSGPDEEPVKVSNNWFIWHINDENFTQIGKLEGENRKAEIGIVVNPYDIIDRIKTGKYNFLYPGLE
ncbi:hypothetical protein [Chryseobacterium fistulae]|uniref:Immunity protein 26 n=1 Tax=Chryseobacterium fistulae TaxID=2675058 RepID=A0A6N4XQM9_9FLAO|nr:hypothetical protein [Chryseobacterium fistulae]CAA7386072.1 hypothetical protein CHRY9393_00362 [Chryseobacterium fistulae]